jgi:hypothetical protein
MSNPNLTSNVQFAFPYDPNAYQNNALLNGLSLNNSIDTSVNPPFPNPPLPFPNPMAAAANFSPYNYGFTTFGDPLNFHNCEQRLISYLTSLFSRLHQRPTDGYLLPNSKHSYDVNAVVYSDSNTFDLPAKCRTVQ